MPDGITADTMSAMSAFHLALRYTLFASFATVVNLLTQEAVVRVLHNNLTLYISIAAGTVTGLVCKYLLDKHYIFAYSTQSHQENLGKFLAYTLTGGFTTALFWGFELGFEYWFNNRLARYAGAVLGLSIGYAVKYRLDKRYVFRVQET